MKKFLDDMYGLIYGELPKSQEQEKLDLVVERIKDPFRGSQDFVNIPV